VFTTPNGGLTVMRADGSATEAVTAPESGARHLSPHVLPDGRTILFTVVGQDVNASHIAVVSLGDRRVRTIVPDGAMTPQYAEGHLLYVRPDRRLMAVAFDPSSATTSGDAVALPDLVSRTRFGVAHYAAVGGLVVYVPPAVGHLVEVERSGRRERLIAEDRNYHHPRYSPDGTRLVFDLTLGGTERDVWIFDRGTRTMSRVTRIGDAHDPSWLPNGREVSFFSFKAGSLMTAPYDGATAPRPVTIGPGFAATDLLNPGSWVPDGSAYVGGVTERGAPSDVWRIPRDGSAPVKLVGSPADEVAPAISPDGRWLAYQSDETGRAEVYVRAIDGREGRVQVSNAGGTGPLWDPRGSTVFYVEPDRDRRLLVAATLSTAGSPAVASRTLVIADLNLEESDNHPNYDVHPDGSRFVVQELEPSAKLIAVFDWVRSVTRR
jgi:hypothetical protein